MSNFTLNINDCFVVKEKEYTSFEKFLTGEAPVVRWVAMALGLNYVKGEIFHLGFEAVKGIEDRGMMYVFPVDDGKFCVKLAYLIIPESADGDVVAFQLEFVPAFFENFPTDILERHMPFRFDETWEMEIPICHYSRTILEFLRNGKPAVTMIDTLQVAERVLELLRKALECATQQRNLTCHVPTCRFLAFDSEREKVLDAKAYLEKHYDRPITIKELSRKVAMNECYLKKGFKALVGKSINEYQQELRIDRAKEMLKDQGQSVTYVAAALGYSSISHFSTAFKKATGLKPCELLG